MDGPELNILTLYPPFYSSKVPKVIYIGVFAHYFTIILDLQSLLGLLRICHRHPLHGPEVTEGF